MKTVMAPHTPSSQMISTGSVMKTDRRASKPLMEKRRRERINKSLNELKSILLNALRKDQSTCHSKLEKADILEMTVRYLRGIQQRQRMSAASMSLDQSMANKYRSGFMDCKGEVTSYLDNSPEGVQSDIKARMMNHAGSAVPPSHIPHMMGQGPAAPRLLTTAPPVPVVNAISPLQVQMSPNTQIQQAMAVAAAAMAHQGRVMLSQGGHSGMSFNATESLEARFHKKELHSSPAHSPVITSATINSSNKPRHVRQNSESSYTSSGFASPGSPIHYSPAASPQKITTHPRESKNDIQGSFVVVPQSTSLVAPLPPPMPVSEQTPRRSTSSPPINPFVNQLPQPISLFSSPNDHSRPSASPSLRSLSPSSSVESDSDSEPVWRPW